MMHVFLFLRQLGEEGSSYGTLLKDARHGFSNTILLAKAVLMLGDIPIDDRNTKGDVYEYMLGKIASAGTNGYGTYPRIQTDGFGEDITPEIFEKVRRCLRHPAELIKAAEQKNMITDF